MKRSLVVVSVAVLSMLAAPPAQASHSWENLHWGRTANPFSLAIVDSVTGTWDGLLRTVSAEWGSSTVLNTGVQSGSSGLIPRLLCQPISGKVRVCNANYGPTLWFGIAEVWLNGSGHITQATTKVNDFYFNGTYGNNVARRHVLCQEVGHDLGLDHVNTASCMNDDNDTLNNTAYLSPNAHDYQQLQAIYSHLDGQTTSNSASAKAFSGSVRRVGGHSVITFVDWV